MKIISHCICCTSKNIQKYPGFLFDFMAYRMFGYDLATVSTETGSYPLHFRCNIILCKDCNYTGSDIRFDEEELNNVYHDYRSATYATDRNKFEPGYFSYNDLLGKNELELSSRRLNLESILSNNVDLSSIKIVIDYGGDEGQFIPKNINPSRKIIFDPSNKIISPEFEKINNLENLPLGDLIMCCHTLEHVSYPQELLKKLKALLSKNAFIYIELPLEVQNTLPLTSSEIPRKIHEHINTFTTQSLTALIKCCGLNVVCIYDKEIESSVPGRHKILSALCSN
jgi:hypothetical protein